MTNPVEQIMSTPAVTAAGSQATAIEQSRAVAEVQAQVVVAQQCPRDEERAVAQMKSACSRRALAEKAFFQFPRAGQTVAGPSIHLARELARCWGNMQYSVSELHRDDVAGMSEMQATAWDVEHNTRSSATFLVPHRRDTKRGVTQIKEMRDIYENNANNGARRVREAIFSVLPTWFVEEAQEVCRRALNAGSPEEQRARAETAISNFEAGGVTLKQLEERVGRKRMAWTPEDVTDLGILFQSLKRKEITREEAFPPAKVTSDELDAYAAALNSAATVSAPSQEAPQITAEPEMTVLDEHAADEIDWPVTAEIGGAR